jgi:hypothetical protein
VHVDDVLTIDTSEIGELRSPVLVIGLAGLFDIADAATTALDRFTEFDEAITIAEIDPDPFYDFTQERPQAEIDDFGVRSIRWPENRFGLVLSRGRRDLVVLRGVEPHLNWRTYSECVQRVAALLGCEAMVSVGSSAEAVPHTRRPFVTGSTTDPDLARVLGIGQPSYEGVTGVIGVIQADMAAAGVPSVSLRVGIPHYLMNAEHPQAVAALQAHLAHVLDVPSPDDVGHLGAEIDRWRALHDEVVGADQHCRCTSACSNTTTIAAPRTRSPQPTT